MAVYRVGDFSWCFKLGICYISHHQIWLELKTCKSSNSYAKRQKYLFYSPYTVESLDTQIAFGAFFFLTVRSSRQSGFFFSPSLQRDAGPRFLFLVQRYFLCLIAQPNSSHLFYRIVTPGIFWSQYELRALFLFVQKLLTSIDGIFFSLCI